MGVRDMDSPTLLNGAERFFYPGNDIGCLVLHGFTGTPGEVRWLGRHLNKQGYTFYGPRLAGHGTHVGDMAYPTWREWYLDALAGYHLLLRQCRKIFVTGLSMGGALALALASREAVDGVAGLAAFYRLPPAVELFVPLAAILIPVWPKNSPPSDDNPFQRPVRGEHRGRARTRKMDLCQRTGETAAPLRHDGQVIVTGRVVVKDQVNGAERLARFVVPSRSGRTPSRVLGNDHAFRTQDLQPLIRCEWCRHGPSLPSSPQNTPEPRSGDRGSGFSSGYPPSGAPHDLQNPELGGTGAPQRG